VRLVPICSLLIAVLVLVPAPVRGQEHRNADVTVTPAFGAAVRPDEPIALRLDRPLPPAAGRIAVVIGHTDYSGLLEATSTGVTYRPLTVPLPEGEHELKVYLVSANNEWRPLGAFPLRVVVGARPARAELVPTFDFSNKGQIGEGHRPANNAPDRATYQDFTVNAGVRAKVAHSGWTTETHINLLGVSNRSEALRFADKAAAAPLVDVLDYVVGSQNHRGGFSLGHVTFGTNRHLLNTLASRGALANLRLGSHGDLALAALHGSTIVGWDNFLGLERRSHRVLTATLGLEMLAKRPGGLRVEASWLDGRLLPLTNFNEGRINDAEQSRGGGVRMAAGDGKQRFRLDGGFARSNFTNPADPLLAQGATVVPVEKTSRNARYLDVSYALLQGKRIGKTQLVNLTAMFRHERVDPLYGSVVADLRSDVLQNVLDLNGSIGPATAQVSYTRARDNLDDVDGILKTFTRVFQVTTAMPLASLWGDGRSSAWWPTMTYALDQIHQRGAGVPLNAGFNSIAQIPNQIATHQTLGVEWRRGVFGGSYRVNRTSQDSRQQGKENSDLSGFVQHVAISLAPGSRIDAQIDLAFEGARNKELAQADLTRRVALIGNWRATSRTAVSMLVSAALQGNEARTSKSRDIEMTLGVSQSVPLFSRASGKPRGQLFVRFVQQSGRRFDRVFGIDDRRQLSTLNTGFSLSLF